MLNITREIDRMNRMSIGQLRERYAEVFGESTGARNRHWMVKRIAWRLQAKAEGDLSERARQRAIELAKGTDLRTTSPKPRRSIAASGSEFTQAFRATGAQQLMPGMQLQREYKGQRIIVTVLEQGVEYAGERYRSLTAVAKAVTGKHWNGFHFFNLRSGRR